MTIQRHLRDTTLGKNESAAHRKAGRTAPHKSAGKTLTAKKDDGKVALAAEWRIRPIAGPRPAERMLGEPVRRTGIACPLPTLS